MHKHRIKIAIQLNHAGTSAMESRIDMQPVSASNLPNKKMGPSSVVVINIDDSLCARRIIDGIWEGCNILSVLQKRDLL